MTILHIGQIKKKEYLERDINKLTFADDIYVLWVDYHVGTNELLIIMHSDPVFQN